jgi:hypothetical protein
VFALIMSLVREPARRTVGAMLTAGLTGVYMSGGGLGIWELLFPLVAMPIAYRGLRSYAALAVVWLLHSGWDILHHLYGNPIWPFMPTSSFGCMIFDALVAVWFLAGAPSLVSSGRRPRSAFDSPS